MNAHTETAMACDKLIQVQAGVPVIQALSTAECLDDAVLRLLDRAVNSDGMDAGIAYLCKFALDVSGALRSAAGTTV